MEKNIEDNATSENIEEQEVENPEENPTVSEDDTEQRLAELEEKNRQMFERTKKAEITAKEAKAELESLSTKSSDEGQHSDEGLALKKEIEELRGVITQQNSTIEIDKLQSSHPELKDRMEDFKTFQENPDNQGMSLKTQAKAFLIENDLYKSATPKRKGLESTLGSKGKVAPSGYMTSEEAKRLRENDSRKYMQLLESGKLKIKDSD